MTGSQHSHEQYVILNVVQDPIVAHSDSPPCIAAQLDAARGARGVCQALYLGLKPGSDWVRQPAQFLGCAACDLKPVPHLALLGFAVAFFGVGLLRFEFE